MHTALLLLAALLVSASAAAACPQRVEPLVARDLPWVLANDVDWLDDGRVLIGARDGILEYHVANGSARKIIAAGDPPAGIRDAVKLATDGRSVVAFNFDYVDVAFDLTRREMLEARRFPAMQMYDVAVRGDAVALLGYPLQVKGLAGGTLWLGKLGAPWESFRRLRAFGVPAAQSKGKTLPPIFPPYSGAVLFTRDGSIAMITPLEPGVLRFGADGTPLPTLGRSLDELVIERLPELSRYAADPLGRYEALLNRQPLADDLIETAAGLAIVVRRFAEGRVWWELWFVDATGAPRRVRLGIDDRRPSGGHLLCDGRGTKVACVYRQFRGQNAIGPARFVLFDLATAKPDASCR